jgi:hypothetical protein
MIGPEFNEIGWECGGTAKREISTIHRKEK